MFKLFAIVTFICCCVPSSYTQAPGPVTRRFQYKHSFKGPQLSQNGQIPFWTTEGDAIAGDESLRVVPSLKSKRGRAYCKTEVSFKNWEVDFIFRVTGRGRLGADGLVCKLLF